MSYNVPVRILQGGATLEIASGGTISILSGGILNIASGGIVQANGSQPTIASLTDNTAGTADSTLAAIPNPGDSPATADALRDDLVANALPAIRNNLADLGAKVNALITALQGAGILTP
ncbi:MAG TPA: hypothetical protein VK176_08340 [Phycisphaerales bacterium]|nr:hypothetical protein [Phycisphaerales bacterium]